MWMLTSKMLLIVNSDSRSSEGIFCPYKITRSGEYSIIGKGAFIVRNCVMSMEDAADALVPISYRINGKRMTLLFQLGNNVYREVYQKVPELGK